MNTRSLALWTARWRVSKLSGFDFMRPIMPGSKPQKRINELTYPSNITRFDFIAYGSRPLDSIVGVLDTALNVPSIAFDRFQLLFGGHGGSDQFPILHQRFPFFGDGKCLLHEFQPSAPSLMKLDQSSSNLAGLKRPKGVVDTIVVD